MLGGVVFGVRQTHIDQRIVARFDEDAAVLAGGDGGQGVQVDGRAQHLAVLMVGMIAQQLDTAGGREIRIGRGVEGGLVQSA